MKHFMIQFGHALAQAAAMRDTIVVIDPTFVVRNVYETRDKLDAVRDSLMWPTLMHDTVISVDSSFIVRDLYPIKDFSDSLKGIPDRIC